jgi:hypothetical protein
LFGKKEAAMIHVQSTEVESVPVKFPTRHQKPRVVEFVEGLAAVEKPSIGQRWALNYICEFDLEYREISIRVDYHTIRHQWDVKIWSHEAGEFLFFHDAFRAQTFLIETYNLNDRLNEAYAEKQEREKDREARAETVIQKYIRQ